MIDAGFSPLNTNWGSGADLITNASNDTIFVKLPAGGVTAVGADIFTVNSTAQMMQVVLSTGGLYMSPTSPNPALDFIGFISDTPITFINFTGINAATGLDNVAFGSAIAAPEPTSLLLIGLGLAGISLSRRRIA